MTTMPQPVILESARVEESPEAVSPRVAWGPARRFGFRFLFTYFILYLLPFPLTLLPKLGSLKRSFYGVWSPLVLWVGERLFHVQIKVRPNGSGDTTFNWVQVFCILVLSALSALVWTLLDRRRPNYTRLYEALRIYVRFGLGSVMFSYGVVKVIELQFATPMPDRLVQTYGESSPMGLLWTFMGASPLYCFFGGAGEVLGGVLLAFRRTTLLGALVCIGVMSNVVMLNMSYDVPVKLFSSHLLAMAVFLAAPDLRRLASFFVLNRPVPPVEERPLFARRGLDRGALILKTLLVILSVGSSLLQANEMSKTEGERAPKPPFYGAWNVDELEIDGQVRPPLLTDGERWRRVIFPYPEVVAFQPMEGPLDYYSLKLDPAARRMAIIPWKKDAQGSLLYRETGPGLLSLEGTFNGRKVRARLRKEDPSKYVLTSRGFHWINERPFSR
jgi:uncharacterized membrane protein YphA (DoxX/SURF4 family)